MNVEELQAMAQAELDQQRRFRCRILVCMSTPCISSGATAVQQALVEALKAAQLDTEVEAVATGCLGPCSRGPLVTIKAEGQEDVIYERVSAEDAPISLPGTSRPLRPLP